MSIAVALNNARSGLAATARGTEIVSANVANALTPGYGRREMMVSASPLTGGVQLDGIDRAVNASLLGDRRSAQAGLGRSQSLAQFWTTIEKTVGTAGDGDSLSDRMTTLEAALTSAASRPDNDVRLGSAARAAADVAAKLNALGTAVVDARTEAEATIQRDVTRLGDSLRDVARLNRSIIIEKANGRDASSLLDQRQTVIDSIAAIVPIREVPRDNGRIALFTAGGLTLLDGSEPVDISFAPAGRLQPSMQVGTPPVGRLVISGEELSERQMQLMAGGSLEASFAIRDRDAPAFQQRLDAMARDLYERFADPALDPTIATGGAGLFTDAGAAFDPANERGFANRIAIAAAVDPDGAAQSWRLRDGLNAAAPGAVGRSTLLAASARALQATRATTSTGIAAGARSAASFAADIASNASGRRLAAEAAQTQDVARHDALDKELMLDGVDTDREMERLLQLENAYAANAKVIAAADAMIAKILEI